jgi:hypothetical protein
MTQYIQRLSLRVQPSRTASVRLASGAASETLLGEVRTNLRLGKSRDAVTLLVLPGKGVPGTDVVLGTDWLARRRAVLSWKAHAHAFLHGWFDDHRAQTTLRKRRGRCLAGRRALRGGGHALCDRPVVHRLFGCFAVRESGRQADVQGGAQLPYRC